MMEKETANKKVINYKRTHIFSTNHGGMPSLRMTTAGPYTLNHNSLGVNLQNPLQQF